MDILTSEIEILKEEICDKICKYRDESTVDPETGLLPECEDCPLDRL